MTSDKMPLMLDDTMDATAIPVDLGVDELFGDAMQVDLSLQPRPISQHLLGRIDDMRRNGGCQSIAWSRGGTIASIAPDGQSLELRFLRCHPETAVWDFSEPTLYSLSTPPPTGGPIVHVAFASTPNNQDLAVIDASGRVSILNIHVNLNRPSASRKWDGDVADDSHAVVGSYWLNVIPQSKQFHIMYGPATKKESDYSYESSYVPAFGPYHPNSQKSAFLCVTTGGLLKMYWPQNINKVEETVLDLESITSSEDMVTHAAICSDKMNLYVVMATSSKELRVVRASISWGLGDNTKVPAPASVLNPSLAEKHVAYTSWLQNTPSDSHLDPLMTQLSILEVLPSQLVPGPGQNWQPPIILAVRSHLPIPGVSFTQELQTVIDRWEIAVEQPQSVHPAWEQLGSRRGNAGSQSQTTTRLKKLEPLILNKILIKIHTLQLGKVICFVFSDGSVEYRDRFTWNEIYTVPNLDKIMTLNDVGLTFAEDSPCLQVAFSPTDCSMAQIRENGKVKWNGLRYVGVDIPASLEDPRYSAVIAALTIATTASTYSHTNYDDILAAARPFAITEQFTHDWITEIVKMIKIPVDYSVEIHHDSLVRNSSLQICLSIQNHMGFRGEFQPRAFSSKFAQLALNVRNVVILITIASNTPVNKEKMSPLDEHEVVDALASCSKWSLDLISWLTDCLFALADDAEFMKLLTPEKFDQMTEYLRSKNDVSVHLLLCSSARGFISAVCRRLHHLDNISGRAIQYYEQKTSLHQPAGPNNPSPGKNIGLYNAYKKMQGFASSSLIKVPEFEKLINGLSEEIRLANKATAAAASSGKEQPDEAALSVEDGARRTAAELQMLLASSPPASFLPVVRKFFAEDLRAFRGLTDPAALFFSDFALLEVEDDRKSLASKRKAGRYVDVFKRVELRAGAHGGGARNGALLHQGQQQGPDQTDADGGVGDAPPQWRRCARCASVMEDVWAQRPGFQFVLNQQRKCSCNGSWALLPRGTLIS